VCLPQNPTVAYLILVRSHFAMSPQTYSWVLAVILPLSTVLIASIFLYGALFSRFRLAFGLISLAGVFFFLSNIYWSAVAFSLFPRDYVLLLFPVQAYCLYLGIAIVVAGDALLVWQITRNNTKT
jgi:hypothetical protein